MKRSLTDLQRQYSKTSANTKGGAGMMPAPVPAVPGTAVRVPVESRRICLPR